MAERGGTMKKNQKKRAALTAAGLAAAAGVVLGSAFADPVDLLRDGPQPSPTAADTLDGGEGGGGSAQHLRGAKRVRSRLRRGVRGAGEGLCPLRPHLACFLAHMQQSARQACCFPWG